MINLYPFLAYVFVTTFTPGPNNILSMTNGTRYGYRKSLGFLAGICAGFFVVMLACGLLNVILIGMLPHISVWLNILGAVYMVYLAVHILRSGAMEDGDEKAGLNSFRAGFALQFLNLKVILYGITIYSMFITPVYREPFQTSLFAPILAVVGFIATSCWALGGDFFREFLRKNYRVFNFAMAALLVYTAAAGLVSHL
jgi:cysteine/O-acetylserine efflux protein